MSSNPSILLPVRHKQQNHRSDCLAACADMLLTYLGAPIPYSRLLKTLRVDTDVGAPFSNIARLEHQRLFVIVEQGTLETLYRLLSHGWPVIVPLYTGELPYWNEATNHAVVVVGMNDQTVYVNDPAFVSGPIQVNREDFELAWIEHNHLYALLVPN